MQFLKDSAVAVLDQKPYARGEEPPPETDKQKATGDKQPHPELLPPHCLSAIDDRGNKEQPAEIAGQVHRNQQDKAGYAKAE